MPQSKAEANKRLRNIFRKSKTKTVVAESGGAVASSSNSVSQSTESTSNSVALSKAFKKLNDIDFSHDIADQLDNELIDYIGKIEQYPNHLLRGNTDPFELYVIKENKNCNMKLKGM
ncbi:uncharacterized protein J4E84_006084 [Alternaria hordeiaustralica]|uniref:uncharacterized protein n=1 Tax=Alternaria hordeiaustralica TaxID=1187925 RepID=UPI0020C2CD8A|nr:uncharacterized protein J4E84_006084 [Alternaria hordeiaustralica]KAI4685357.1 hypothetical protein J4E84_006084 [Alternaria hordeiaustralica]